MIVPQAGASGAPAPYGLALELAKGGPVNPLHIHPPGGSTSAPHRSAKRTLNQQFVQAGAGWPPTAMISLGLSPLDLHAQQQQMPMSATTMMPPGVIVGPSMRPEDEPDYGIVAELKQAGPADPLAVRDFGLAAEVARRRGGAQPPLGGQYGETGASSLPPLRPRKRLAAAGPPANFGLSKEIAERQAQYERDKADPFNAANRASGQDPFVMADELVKFPTVPYQPQPPQQQV